MKIAKMHFTSSTCNLVTNSNVKFWIYFIDCQNTLYYMSNLDMLRQPLRDSLSAGGTYMDF